MLYLILPYFDFNQSILSKNNLDLFISNYAKRANLRIVLCEGVYNEELPDYSDKIFKHLKFKLKNVLWAKENLINLAIKNLPDDAEFIAWSDRDIYFLNPLWVEETIEKLKTHDIIQPWSEVLLLNSRHEPDFINTGVKQLNFSFKSKLAAKILYPNHKGKIATSPGQVWAFNKSFYKKIGKLNDIEIIGGADLIIAVFCIINDPLFEKDLNKKTTSKSKKSWIEYKEKFKDIKYSYIDGLIIHYWHGDLKHRKYLQRTEILKNLDYNPEEDISYDEDGVIQFTEKGKRFELPIKEYFQYRKENEKITETPNNPMFCLKYTAEMTLIPAVY
jgi:hypothetical protein